MTARIGQRARTSTHGHNPRPRRRGGRPGYPRRTGIPEAPKPPSKAWPLAALLFAAGGVALAAGGSSDSQETQITTNAVGAAILCAGLVAALATTSTGRLTQMSLAAWMIAYSGVAVGLASLTYLGPQHGSQRFVSAAEAPEAIGILVWGLTLVTIAYLASTHLKPPSTPHALPKQPPRMARLLSDRPSRILLGYGIGLTATFASFAATGSFGYLGDSEEKLASVSVLVQPLAVVAFLRTAALVAATIAAVRRPARWRTSFVAVLLVAELALATVSGMKENFLVPCVAVLIPYVVVRHRLPWAWLALALAGFVFFVTPFVSEVREVARGDGQNRGVNEVASVILDRGPLGMVMAEGAAEPEEQHSDLVTVASRLRLADSFVMINERSPDPIPYRSSGELITAVGSSVVPRALWPNKPLRLTGLEFYQQYYDGMAYNSSAVTFQGSLWLYGGAVPHVLGCLALGFALRAVDRWSQQRALGAGGLLLMVLFSDVVKQELDAASILAAAPIYAATVWCAVVVLGTRPQLREETP